MGDIDSEEGTLNFEGRPPIAFTESNWEGKITMYQSTRGNAILFYGGVLTWRSYEQRGVPTSTREARYLSLPECVQALRHHCQVFRELGKEITASVVHEDCHSALGWV